MALVAPGGAPPPPPPPPGGGGNGGGPPTLILPDYDEDLGFEDRRARARQMEQIRQRLSRLRGDDDMASAQLRRLEQLRENGEIPYNRLWNLRRDLGLLQTQIRQRQQEIQQLDIRLINLGGGLDVMRPTAARRRAMEQRGPRPGIDRPAEIRGYLQEQRVPEARQRYPLSKVYPPKKRQKR